MVVLCVFNECDFTINKKISFIWKCYCKKKSTERKYVRQYMRSTIFKSKSGCQALALMTLSSKGLCA